MTLQLTTDAVLTSLSGLPAFPRIVTQVLATLDDENSSMTTLVNYLQHDPVLAGRVLAAANASEHGHRAMGGIPAAVSFIGMRRIREIVLTTCLLDLTRHARGVQVFREHCLAVGICAQELARELSLDQDCALVAGLLHDIGKLWMVSLHPQAHRQMQDRLAVQQRPLCEVEREVFGMDHCAIGEIIARHWDLPESIVEAIVAHHYPERPNLGQLAAIIHVSEAISNGLDLPFRDENQVIEISTHAIQVAGLNWNADVSDLLGRIEARFLHASPLMH